MIPLIRRCVVLGFISLLSTSDTVAQSQEKLYSLLILNFAKGIHWPVMNESFVVGVLGYPPLVSELEATVANTNIHGRKIRVKMISNVDEVKGCHILFIPSYKVKLLPEVLTNIPSDPTLIITNKNDAALHGGCVDFVLKEGKLTYDINCKATEDRGLKVSKAIRVGGRVVNL